ncbi:LLM class flavin-dependent oxidoreductase [Paenibacillus sp. S150]|uniref:LLM class flavin-dependent oxidoreductase n=1 Tax=Paenibacillus sp. S150 TaxID=2749826 RepID=UPI001C5722E7|nr:LLM class flavin-dependent oxidoreductase [Paenibacillus sp. S150]MBW4081982.1 LLM class flavin-dependent oxidoreductase [Paenibacillus sp. S150]
MGKQVDKYDALWTPPEPQDNPDSPLSKAFKQPLMLGLFLPFQTGGWSQSTLPRGTDWTYAYNSRVTKQAEAFGFDVVFGLSQWLPKGGFGGEMSYRENFLDPFVTTVALAAETSRILLLGTIHILYGPWHPMHLARFLAAADHISQGRFGANIVTGYAENEPRMFGAARKDHDSRYEQSAEFIRICNALWSGNDNLTYEGEFYSLEEAYVSPRPLYGRPVLASASGSPAGFRYAGQFSDIVFVSSPAGEKLSDALPKLPDHAAAVRNEAAARGRNVRVIINPTIIVRPTRQEAEAYYQAIMDHADLGSIRNFYARHAAGDSVSWLEHSAKGRAVGGHLHIVGSPEEVAGQLAQLHAAGIDGIQITFYDYEPELAYFSESVIPLLEQQGLRLPVEI